MKDAFGVDRESVSKGAVKTILFGAKKVKQPRIPEPPKVSRVTGEPIAFNPKIPTKPQKVFWGKNPVTGQSAVQRSAGYQAKRRERLAQNTPMFPKSAAPAGPPKKWYQKRTNQAMMAGGAAAFGGTGYAGYRSGRQG